MMTDLINRRVALIFFLVALPFYYCCLGHFCMCGHLAHNQQHGWLNDGLWMVLLAIATIAMLASRHPFRMLIASGVFLLYLIRVFNVIPVLPESIVIIFIGIGYSKYDSSRASTTAEVSLCCLLALLAIVSSMLFIDKSGPMFNQAVAPEDVTASKAALSALIYNAPLARSEPNSPWLVLTDTPHELRGH